MSILSSISNRLRSIIKNTCILLTWIAGIILIISAYSGYINPEDSARPAILGMIFPFVLVTNILILVFWLFARKWLMVLLEIGILSACATPIITFSPFNFSKKGSASSNKTFTILTYNVMNFASVNYQKNTGNDLALKYILDKDADFVLLQEASAKVKMDELEALNHLLPELNKKYPYREKRINDLVIMSKYPYKVENSIITRNAPHKSNSYKVTINDTTTLHIINVHLESLKFTDSDKALYRNITDISKSPDNINEKTVEDIKSKLLTKLAQAFKLRAAQAKDIRNYIDNLGDANVILCGDFNDTPYSYAYLTTMGDDMNDAYRECAIGPTITFHENRFYFRIDHILYKGNFKASSIQRGNEKHSDHYPLFATFEWN